MISLKTRWVTCLLIALAWVPLASADKASGRHVVMGGASDGLRIVSKQEADTTFNIYLVELYRQYGAGWTLQILMYPDVPNVLAAFDKGEIDGFFGSPLDYLARKDKLGKSVTMVKFRHSNYKQPFLLVVRAGDGIKKLGDLQGKRLSIMPSQDMEMLYLNTLLLRNRFPEVPDFFNVQPEIKTTNVALMDVFFKKADIAVIRENEYKIAAELNPQLAKQLIVLDQSAPMMTTLGVVSNKLSESEFNQFFASFNKIVKTEKGKKLLELVQVDDVALTTDKDLKNVADLVAELASLRKLKADSADNTNITAKKKARLNAQ